MSLLDINAIPEKEFATVICCKICKGKMHELPKSLATKIRSALLPEYKHAKTYRCEECHKELHTRES